MKRPLDGIKVLDLSRYLPGPLIAQILSILGARVIKVEYPGGGDPIRGFPPFIGGVSSLGATLLKGIESISLDLTVKDGKEAFLALLERSDLLIESFRPKTKRKLGVSKEDLKEFDNLIICSITGWGEDNEWSDRIGHDLNYQAASGALVSSNSMPAAPYADIGGALFGVIAILTALYQRKDGNSGPYHIQLPLVASSYFLHLTTWTHNVVETLRMEDKLPLSGALPCYRLYKSKDEKLVAVALLEPHLWEKFLKIVGRQDLKKSQYSYSEKAHRKVEALFSTLDSTFLNNIAEKYDLPITVALTPDQSANQDFMKPFVKVGIDRALSLTLPFFYNNELFCSDNREISEVGEDSRKILYSEGLERFLGKEGVGKENNSIYRKVKRIVFNFRRYLGSRK